MRKYIILLTALFTIGCQQGAMAQKSADQSKEQKLLASEAKYLAKEGWKPIPGFKSVKEQLGETVSYSKNNDSTYILGASNAEAEDLITAYHRAYYDALVDIAHKRLSEMDMYVMSDTVTVSAPSEPKAPEFESKHLISITGLVKHDVKMQDDVESEKWDISYLFEIAGIRSGSHSDGNSPSTFASRVNDLAESEDVKTCYGIYRVQKNGKIEVRLMLAAPKK